MADGSRNGQLCGNVVSWIKTMLEQLPIVNVGCSIYRVPKLLREMNNTAFIPQVISIGLFHHRSREDLIVTEQYKLQGLANFLLRTMNMNSVEFLVETAQTWVKDARDYYAEPINMNDEDFIKMLLVDGCFIVELLILNYGQYDPDAFIQIEHNRDLQFYKRFPHIGADLVKLENQIPFFVLQRLFDLVKQKDPSISFIRLTTVFFHHGIVNKYYLSSLWLEKCPKHFIDFLSFFFVPTIPSKNNSKEEESIIPPSITELREASVIIKKAKHGGGLMNVSFKNGVFEIPPILIDDYFETMMRNLIAFEHFYVGNDNKCIQYVSLLDHLICTEKDVSVLVQAGIIINEIGGSSIEVSELFNNLCKFVTVPNCCHFNDINKALREHCSRRWNKAKATLKHNYFNTPWAVVSLVGAILLLILAILQTIFSGIQVFSKK
ncbi:UPF0481 protein At3g47200-like [Cucurbita pepo subsp. pepo]|uniref:UPF0481 protein At3g47200-like n=1 Tax=Cucurbita pepo subsp. pepo TaxID=3664 RepID=UPI000C9D9407|nr:UPF0481 protein At3g47200-like [Cucurbita pepo subsp. pepo]